MIHLVGDGIAGRLLAQWMLESDLKFVQYGDGRTNTPPVGFVHLFQGRTFHRDAIEVEAFRRTIEFWRNESLASEWEVERSVAPGDRLDRSADTETVPEEWRPVRVAPDLYRYGPGFTVQAGALGAAVPVEVVSRQVAFEDWDGRARHGSCHSEAFARLPLGYQSGADRTGSRLKATRATLLESRMPPWSRPRREDPHRGWASQQQGRV